MSRLTIRTAEEAHGFRRIGLLLILLVVVPTVALLALGILMLVFWRANLNLVFGVLVVTLVAILVTGTVLAFVLLHREAALSRLQLDFVSKVSHELRTPLTSIKMFGEMLESSAGDDPEEARVCLEVLRRETERLSERIERLLGWGRMEAGRRRYVLRPEAAAEVVAAAVEALQPLAAARGDELQVEVEPGLPPIAADREALVDALVNLLANAYKYTGDERTIALRARADERWVRLEVADNGPGIPRREHRRIFDKFYRPDDRLARSVEGSGLGLAIVRHVVRGHRGRIELDSEPGRGSTFTILLPRPKERPGEAPRAEAAGGR